MSIPSPTFKHQTGAVLVISLIMLLLLTLIGVSGSQNTSLEEKMAANVLERNIAFQAAETTLRAAENALLNTPPVVTFAGTTGAYAKNSAIPLTTAVVTDAFWSTNPVVSYQESRLENGALNSYPQAYIVQDMGVSGCLNLPCGGDHIYRVTVRATGRSANAVVILQSFFKATPG